MRASTPQLIPSIHNWAPRSVQPLVIVRKQLASRLDGREYMQPERDPAAAWPHYTVRHVCRRPRRAIVLRLVHKIREAAVAEGRFSQLEVGVSPKL